MTACAPKPWPWYPLAWLLAAAVAAGLVLNTRFYAFADPGRPGGHSGHVAVDFGGQWVLGRMLVRGYGGELYHRHRLWEVVQDAYPRADEPPGADRHDAEILLSTMMGEDDPRWRDAASAAAGPLAAAGPWQAAALLRRAREELSPGRLAELDRPPGPEGVGGALYPPIHALLFAPLALGDHPREALLAWQGVLIGLAFLTGLGASVLSGGRFWWPLAATLVMLYPGFRGALDLGQNAPLTLAVLVWGWVLMARGWPGLGGAVWGLLAYKPVWAVSFFLALVLMRRWRACLGMLALGAALGLATLPAVGVHAWLDWLRVSRAGAALYNVDYNWVSLSRDLFGIPRRFLLDFERPLWQRENLAAALAGWALWLLVLETTVRTYLLAGRKRVPDTGPLPAFLLLGAWACTYRFMYYDVLASLLAVFVLMADPRPFFRPLRLTGRVVDPDPLGEGLKDGADPGAKPTPSGGLGSPGPPPVPGRTVCVTNSVVLSLLAALMLVENPLGQLKLH
ncbi:MAG TPA: glycosyltransferase family 87 protein, partial [Gemmataceae bacterium]